MNDYKFGEYLYKLRSEAGLSQAELADKEDERYKNASLAEIK